MLCWGWVRVVCSGVEEGVWSPSYSPGVSHSWIRQLSLTFISARISDKCNSIHIYLQDLFLFIVCERFPSPRIIAHCIKAIDYWHQKRKVENKQTKITHFGIVPNVPKRLWIAVVLKKFSVASRITSKSFVVDWLHDGNNQIEKIAFAQMSSVYMHSNISTPTWIQISLAISFWNKNAFQ